MKCDFCKLGAVVNLQKVWIKFDIDRNDRYREDKSFDCMDIEEPIEGDNLHLCKAHSKEWLGEED